MTEVRIFNLILHQIILKHSCYFKSNRLNIKILLKNKYYLTNFVYWISVYRWCQCSVISQKCLISKFIKLYNHLCSSFINYWVYLVLKCRLYCWRKEYTIQIFFCRHCPNNELSVKAWPSNALLDYQKRLWQPWMSYYLMSSNSALFRRPQYMALYWTDNMTYRKEKSKVKSLVFNYLTI